VAGVYGAEERAALAELLAEAPDAWRAAHPLPAAEGEGVEPAAVAEDGGAQAKGDEDRDGRAAADAAADRRPPPASVFTVWDERTSARAFDRGLRIDYVLVSPRLLSLIVSAEILGKDLLPAKWSDHAAVRVVLRRRPEGAAGEELLAPPAPHAPCALSSAVDERWAARPRGQRSIASFFAPKRPAAAAAAAGGAGAGAGAGEGAGGAGGAGEGGAGAAGGKSKAEEAPAPKRPRAEASGGAMKTDGRAARR